MPLVIGELSSAISEIFPQSSGFLSPRATTEWQ